MVQVLLGLMLVALSAFFLWKDTLKPVVKKLQRGESLGDSFRESLKQSARYQNLQKHAEELEREREKAKLESLKAEREGSGQANSPDSGRPNAAPAPLPPEEKK